jgi:hypothetical protein
VPDEHWLAKHLVPLGYRVEGQVHGNTVFVSSQAHSHISEMPSLAKAGRKRSTAAHA